MEKLFQLGRAFLCALTPIKLMSNSNEARKDPGDDVVSVVDHGDNVVSAVEHRDDLRVLLGLLM